MRNRIVMGVIAVLVLSQPAACGRDDDDKKSDSAPLSGRSAEVVDFRTSDEGGKPTTEVVAQDNRFVPENIRISPGQTVRWKNQGQNQHNIMGTGESTEYAPDFGVPDTDFAPGSGTYEFTFDKPGVYLYYCTLHGTPDQGMVGAIIVGEEEWKPPTVRAAVAKKPGTLTVPDDYDTIQAAVDAAAEGAMVMIDPGVYEEAVVVNSPNIVIRGKDRNETILDGGFKLGNGFHVFADGVAIENLTARNYATNGFFWDGATGYRASYLTAYNNGDYGVYAFASVNGQFDHSYASGSTDSSFYVGQCNPCHAVLTDLLAEYSQLGYSGTNASDVTIVNSTWRYNRIGIVPNSQDVEELPPVYRNTYVGNVVYGNSNLEAATATNELYDAMVGSGIVMMGTQDSLVARNRVYDHEWFGIVLAPFPSDNLYTVDNTRVEGNLVENSRHADLALVFSNADQGNCFSRNEFTTSAPTGIEERVPCDGKFNADMTPGAVPPGDLLDRDEPEGKPYRDQPIPPPQPNMPDVDADPLPARAGVVPLRIDVDAIAVPPKRAS